MKTHAAVGVLSLALACVACGAFQSDPMSPAAQVVQVNDAREDLCEAWRGGGRLLVPPGAERKAGDAACALECKPAETP